MSALGEEPTFLGRLPIAALALFVSELRDTPLLAHYG
jgi:hypothetical protein